MGFLDWLKDVWDYNAVKGVAASNMNNAKNIDELNAVWNGLTTDQQADTHLSKIYRSRMGYLDKEGITLQKPLQEFIGKKLKEWVAVVDQFKHATPENAADNLAAITGNAVSIAAASAAIDLGLGMLPNNAGAVSSTNTKHMLTWLGFGAVIAAIAHDPVKIGVLRPYQDSLEMTFRNRRPDDFALFQAYRTRELSPIKVDDLDKLDEAEMNRIENDNETFYDTEIAKWGYSEWFATALKRSATRTLNFSQLMSLARMGYYHEGFFTYCLWGEGLDRVTMKPALNSLKTARDREMYTGFRSMIEPSYVDGLLSEEDLKKYWSLAGVPKDVQDWVFPRMKKRRDAIKRLTISQYCTAFKKGLIKKVVLEDRMKQEGYGEFEIDLYVQLCTETEDEKSVTTKERDLTVSQIQQSYEKGLVERIAAFNYITSLGYSEDETNILLNLAELRKKTPAETKLKILPLGDYEKAYKAGIISRDAVMLRMQREYEGFDVNLELALLDKGKA